ncbi:riboflavin biosynthesis protein RibF [bacterium]|nr:riboflavin biosynthesis protein RibF [bacterium]
MVDWEFKVFGNAEIIRSKKPIALTIGNFDGVHKGHMQLLQKLAEFADGIPRVVLTFDPHPSSVVAVENSKPALISLAQKIELLLTAGVDAVVVQKFSPEFASLSADDFLFRYLWTEFNILRCLIGFDFCYGAGRKGDWNHFEKKSGERGVAACKAEPFLIDGLPVSSSRIRNAVLAADFSLVERLLGRSFCLNGTVVKGDQRGRQIGFPTANLGLFDRNCLLPPHGVYAAEVLIEGEQKSRAAVMNCGVRPTIADGLRLQIEAHILDFSDDIYGRKISFALRKFIRTEMKFSDLEHLKRQIHDDAMQSRLFFGV